jgi:hypothetical protein
MRNLKLAIALGASLIAFVCPAMAQTGYAKVQSPWFPQGKILGGINVGNTSAATLLPSAGQDAWICNTGSVDVYLAFGPTNTISTTVAGGTWLKAGTCWTYDLKPFTILQTYVAAISASSTTLTVETGIGTGPYQLSTSGGGGGGGSVTQGTSPWVDNITQWASTVIAAPTAWGTAPTGGSIVPNMNVNCVVGCAGGSTSNASSGVATSSTNGASVAYNYGFNGTTWDQLQVDGSKNLKVVIAAGNITGFATATLQGTNTATTAHTCSVAGFSELGCLGAINDSLTTLNTTAASSPIPSGTNIIGKVGIDQTTPGTTNGVQVNAALPSGTNLLGKTGLDQTTPGTTNGVAIVGVNSATVLAGAGAVGTGSQRIAVGQDTTTIAGSAPGPAADTASVPAVLSPTSSATSAVSGASTTALGTSLVAKASAGNLYGFNCTGVTGGAAGYCIVYNGTTAPSTGALTGANVLDFCYFDTTARGCSLGRHPMAKNYSTGIVVLVSSAVTPYTYTTGTDTAAISVDYK